MPYSNQAVDARATLEAASLDVLEKAFADFGTDRIAISFSGAEDVLPTLVGETIPSFKERAHE